MITNDDNLQHLSSFLEKRHVRLFSVNIVNARLTKKHLVSFFRFTAVIPHIIFAADLK